MSFQQHPPPFLNRRAAGVELASKLRQYADRDDVVVLALPRGGVPVAYEVATQLAAPLDVFVVRKLGLPAHPELAMGAIASGGIKVLNDDVVNWFGIRDDAIEQVARQEQIELERRERAYRGGAPPRPVAGRTVIVIDDGLATGSSMKAAVRALRALNPARIVVGVPVGSPRTCEELDDVADEVVCARTPENFSAVGQWYLDFSQTSDEEVHELLQTASGPVVRRR